MEGGDREGGGSGFWDTIYQMPQMGARRANVRP